MSLIVRQNFKKNARLFKSVQQELRRVLGDDIFIEHIGSTAVKRMWGKNIIDIVIGVSDEREVEKTVQKLERHKFFRGRNHASGSYIFMASRQSETKSGDVHLHVVVRQSEAFNDFLSLKAYLCANGRAVSDYVAHKRFAVRQAQNDRERYKALKSLFMAKIIEDARKFNRVQNKILKK